MKIPPLKGRRGACALFFSFNAAILLVCLLYLFVMKIYDTHASEPFCSFQNAFHLYCPGCGGSRALRYLLTLRLPSAFVAYPPIFVGVGIIIYAEILLILGIKKEDPYYINNFKIQSLTLFPLAAILFFFIRNALLFAGIDFLGDIL